MSKRSCFRRREIEEKFENKEKREIFSAAVIYEKKSEKNNVHSNRLHAKKVIREVDVVIFASIMIIDPSLLCFLADLRFFHTETLC